MNITQKSSPNFTKGRNGFFPEVIVLHIMDGSLTGTDSWFANPVSKVSSHYGIGLNGEIHQYVANLDQAWTQGYHQGATFKLHKPNVNPNAYCLSIEHEGKDLSIVHEAQINASVELIRLLAGLYNIPIDRDHIIGHYEVDPVRKPNCPATDKSVIDRIVRQAQQTDKEKTKVEIRRLLDTL